MHQDDDAVPRQPQVRLDGVRPGLDRPAERLHRVLRGHGAVAAVRHGLRQAAGRLAAIVVVVVVVVFFFVGFGTWRDPLKKKKKKKGVTREPISA